MSQRSVLSCLLVALLVPATAQTPATGFHHLHLNSLDPSSAIAWYLKTFPVTSHATVGGFDGIASEKIHLLFSKVAAPPVSTLNSPIWHFGWGSPDMPGDFAKHQAAGVRFATPLSTLAQGTVFAYMNAPDEALVEINSAQTRAFVHVHLYSEKPLCTADWYEKQLGGTRRGAAREGPLDSARDKPCEVPYGAPSEPLAVIRSPAATVRFDDVSLIIYPRQRPGPLVTSAGHVVDHVALSVNDLKGTLTRLRSAGVGILRDIHPFGNGSSASGRGTTAALIEGPDSIVIELVERP